MTSYTGNSPKDPNKYVGPNVYQTVVVARLRRPTGNDLKQPETGRYYRTSSFWLIGPDPTNGVQGELWYLSKIVSNVAYWVLLSSGTSGPLLTLTGDDSVQVTPDGSGNIDLIGTVVANSLHAKPVYFVASGANAEALDVQVASAEAASNINKAGLSSYDNTQFTVDANGFVQLVGGDTPSIQKINVDAHTAPGTDPVIADAAGQITVTGGQVAAGTIGANVIRTNSLAANTYTVEIQRSTTNATSDSTKNGVSHFDSSAFTVDPNGFVQSTVPNFIPGVGNLGISYNAGTGLFSITSANGSALSATNPGFVTLASKANPGRLTKYTITANQTFIDDNGASTIIGNLFGLTAGVAYTQDLPFFIYAVTNDAENAISFMISRVPQRKISPASANIGKTGSAVASTQGSFFAFENPTVTDYDANPCLCIGAFRMRMSAANDWTVQTLSNGAAFIGSDGIGYFHNGTIFSMPTGTFGASAGSFFADNGGTAPIWTVQSVNFCINPDGLVSYNGAGNTNSRAGAGAVVFLFKPPYTHGTTPALSILSISGFMGVTSSSGAGGNTSISWDCVQAAGGLVNLQNGQVAAAADWAFSANVYVNIA